MQKQCSMAKENVDTLASIVSGEKVSVTTFSLFFGVGKFFYLRKLR